MNLNECNFIKDLNRHPVLFKSKKSNAFQIMYKFKWDEFSPV